MNEEAIQDSYNVFVSQGYTKSIEEYKKLIKSNPEALNDSYKAFANQGYGKSLDDYKVLMGIGVQPEVKKKETSDSSTISQERAMVSPSAPTSSATQPIDEEEDYFTGSFGNVLRGFDNIVPLGIGDFVDDMARSVSSGYRQGTVAEAADRLLLKGHKATPEQLKKFIDANKEAQQIKPSAEMQNYTKIYEEEGKGFWGVIKGLASNPSIIPEVMASSLTSMATNTDALTAAGSAIGTGATYGAITGAAATPEFAGAGAIPGAISGAASAVPYAFGLASTVVETGATFGELLTEELKGKEMTKENVKAILESPEKLKSIRNKAIARGVVIGTLDALTGKLASGVGAKILTKSASRSAAGVAAKSAVVKSTSVGAGIEAAGGSIGEAAARAAIGQDMDVSEIALEGLAELPGGVRSTIQARFAKPSYKVNGEKVTASDIDDLIETMTPEQLHATDIVINNDYEGRMFKIQDKVVTSAIKKEVRTANPNLNEPSLNAITELEKELKGLEGNKTQTGKDKASLLRNQIKDIQENQLADEVVSEVEGSFETPEISSLDDYNKKVLEDEKSYDWQKEMANEYFADKRKYIERTLETAKRNLKENPESGFDKGSVERAEKALKELDNLKLKEDAIQEQTTDESVLRTEQPELGLQGVGEGNAQPIEVTEETITTEKPQEVEIPDWHREEYDLRVKNHEERLADSKEQLEKEKSKGFFSRNKRDIKYYEESLKYHENNLKLLKENPVEYYKNLLKETEERYNDALDDDFKNSEGKTYKERITDTYGSTDFNIAEAPFVEYIDRTISDYEAVQKTANENAKPKEVEIIKGEVTEQVVEGPPTETAPVVEPVKMPKNKAERKEAAIKGDVVYHRFFETIIESTPEQYNEALKEVAETGAIENALNYGKAVPERQVPNSEEVQYGPTLLDMTKEDADYYLKERTKPTETVAETTPEVAPVVEGLKTAEEFITEIDEKANADENKVGYPIEVSKGVRISKVDGVYSISFPDSRPSNGIIRKVNLTKEQAINILNKKIPKAKVKAESTPVAEPPKAKTPVSKVKPKTAPVVKPKAKPVSVTPEQKATQIDTAIQALFDRNGTDTSKWLNPSDNRDLIALKRAKKALSIDAKTFKTFLSTSMGERYSEMEAKFEAPKVEAKPAEAVAEVEAPKVEPKKSPKTDKEIAQLEKDDSSYQFEIEDLEENIKTETQNTKEGLVELKEKIKKEIEEVKKDKSLSKDEKLDKIEEIKYEIENFKDEQESIIENYKEDLKEAKAEQKKVQKKLDKLKQGSVTEETVLEDVKGKIDELLELDPTDKNTLKKVSDFLGEAIDDIDRIGTYTGANTILLKPMKLFIQAIKALVDGGMALQEAIKKVAADENLKVKDVVNGINSINEIAKIAPAYNALMDKADKLIARQKSKGTAEKKIISNLDTMVRDSDVYKDPNTNDAQRKIMEREARAKMGVAPRKAPSIGRVLGVLNDIKNVSREEKLKIISRIRELSRDATKDLVQEIRDLAKGGKITAVQATNIISRFGKVNMLNEISVSNFVDYMAKVFADAEYGNKIEVAKSNLKTAKKNIVTKLGIADGLVLPLQRLFSINPTLIPDAYLDKYLSLVDMFSKKQAVLSLDEKSNVIKDVQEILDEINNEKSLVDELSDRFNNSDNKVFKDDKLDYAASLEKMLKEGDIDNDDVALMKKYKKDIAPQVEKSELTEEEIQEEKDVLVGLLNKATVDFSELPSRDERNLAKQISLLIKKSGIKELTNIELKNILKVIDNINNGYLPHYAQLVVEKLNSIEDAKVLESAINRAKPLPLSKIYSKAKSLITKKDSILEMIRRNPLFNIDQVFGDFKAKDIFNSILKKAAEAEAKFTSELKNIQAKLEKAEENIAKSHGLNPNKTLMSKFKMMTYMVQLEYDSNPNNKQVNPAAEYLKATIKHIDDGKSQFGERDAEMLQEIYDEYTDSEGNIDNEKLYNSFNKAEKEGIKTIREINESLKEKAEYTGAIIRGQKINPLNNYVHLNVLHEYQPNDLASGTSFANDYNNSMRPTTKAKSLIERTGKVSPLNFDVFASAQRGSKFVLMDYHLTEPIRTARKTMNKAISNLESTGRIPKEKRKIANAISNALEEAVSNLITNSYTTTSVGDDVIDYISKQGYRSVLAGTGRFAAEFISNVGFVLLSDPTSFVEGVKNMGVIMSSDAPAIMSNVNSKEINRIFPTDTLSGRMVDTNILSEVSGVKGGKSKNTVVNKIQQIWNLSGKKYANAVELTADILITTPDKAIMRPIWFGSFSENFRKIAGKDVDFEKIAANDEAYMEENKEAIEEAKNIADERSVITGASSNAFTGILKGTSKPEQSYTIKAFNNFNGFMSKFLIYEFVTARTGIMAAMGNGSLTKRQGVALLGAVTIRMTVYSLLVKALGEGVIGLLFDDDDDEDKKEPKQAVGQALASSFTSMIFGRDFGNSTKGLINYGIERVNENYLDFLREGKYDPYKDALQYSVVPVEKKGSQTDLSDFLFNMTGSFGPIVKTTDLAVRKYFEPERKEPEAIEKQQKEISTRIPLEILGNLGFVPLYKEIRKSVMKDIYKKTLEEQLLGTYESKEQMKKYNPKLYEKTFGEGTMYYRIKKREEKANAKLKERLKDMKARENKN